MSFLSNKCFLRWLICFHFADINGRTGAMDYFYSKKIGFFSLGWLFGAFASLWVTRLSLWFCYTLKLIWRQGKASLRLDYFMEGLVLWPNDFLHFIKIFKQRKLFGLIRWPNQLIVSNNSSFSLQSDAKWL